MQINKNIFIIITHQNPKQYSCMYDFVILFQARDLQYNLVKYTLCQYALIKAFVYVHILRNISVIRILFVTK